MSDKRKIIIIGAKEKVSPEMLENIRKHYENNCEIEIMTKEEYKSLYGDFVQDIIEQEHQKIELLMKRMELDDYLPSNIQEDKLKPFVPKKTGIINNKKLSHQSKQFSNGRRGR